MKMDAIVCGDKTTKYLLWLILSQLAVVFSEETKLPRIGDDQRGATRVNS